MHIPSYQIHNVLNVYSRQISQSKGSEKEKAVGWESTIETIKKSSEGKRLAIIEKVANDIVYRITNFGSQEKADFGIIGQLGNKTGQRPDIKEEKDTRFVYNVIDHLDNKTTNTLSVEDSRFVVKRLELAREAVDNPMES